MGDKKKHEIHVAPSSSYLHSSFRSSKILRVDFLCQHVTRHRRRRSERARCFHPESPYAVQTSNQTIAASALAAASILWNVALGGGVDQTRGHLPGFRFQGRQCIHIELHRVTIDLSPQGYTCDTAKDRLTFMTSQSSRYRPQVLRCCCPTPGASTAPTTSKC